MVFGSQGPVWITPGHILQIASASANLLFKKSIAEAKSVLFRLCTALISSSWVCISSGHPGGYLWLHCLWNQVSNVTVDLTPWSAYMTVCKQQVCAVMWPHIWHLFHAVERAQELKFGTSAEVLCLLSTAVHCSAFHLPFHLLSDHCCRELQQKVCFFIFFQANPKAGLFSKWGMLELSFLFRSELNPVKEMKRNQGLSGIWDHGFCDFYLNGTTCASVYKTLLLFVFLFSVGWTETARYSTADLLVLLI